MHYTVTIPGEVFQAVYVLKVSNSFSSGVLMFFVYVRPVSVIVPWFFRQYRRLLALLALAEMEIVVMTEHRIHFWLDKTMYLIFGLHRRTLALVQCHQICLSTK